MPLADPTNTDTAKRTLVSTYNSQSYADPWDAVEDYERVQEAAAKYPEKGSQALSTVVELPRSRIRTWVDDGGMPDPYRALQTALDRGWLVESWDSDEARALNVLAAWVLASGSVDERWVPSFVVDDEIEREMLKAIGHTLDIQFDFLRSSSATRPSELRPVRDASVLGRVLYTWTGVRGDKSPRETVFPVYLDSVPQSIAADFARIYVQLRHTDRTDELSQRNPFLQIQADRTDSFRRALASLLRRVVSDPSAIRATSWPVRIYEPALSGLRQWPEWVESESR